MEVSKLIYSVILYSVRFTVLPYQYTGSYLWDYVTVNRHTDPYRTK